MKKKFKDTKLGKFLGKIAPSILPKCGVPVLCIPVKTLGIVYFYKNNKSVDKFTKSS